jgi:Predicted membrane protein (DUF2306)
MKEALERIGTALVWALAGMGMVTAISGYLLPAEVHVEMAKPFYGAYADKQFPVLDSHYAVSFFHRFGGFLFMALVPLQLTPRLRARHITFHRWSGRFLIVVGVIFGVSALVMAGRFPYAGAQEIIPMYFFGLIFLYSIIRAAACPQLAKADAASSPSVGRRGPMRPDQWAGKGGRRLVVDQRHGLYARQSGVGRRRARPAGPMRTCCPRHGTPKAICTVTTHGHVSSNGSVT